MIIDLGSFAFGSSLQNGVGTPSWSTALGQSRPEYKITREGAQRLLMGMVYCSVPKKNVKMPIGRGGRVYSGDEVDEIQMVSVFHNVYVNNVKIDYPFILVLGKEESESHPGRRSVRYSDKTTYQDGDVFYGNTTFIKKVRDAFGLSDDACWFAYDIDVKKQDILLISMVVVDPKENQEYLNSEVRKRKWTQLIPDLDSKQLGIQSGDGTIYDLDCSELIDLLKTKHNLVLTGAPGTGKTWLAKAMAKQMGAVSQFVQFHPSYDYTDFVEGLRPSLPNNESDNENAGVSFERIDGIFKDFCKEALESLKDEETKDIPYVFIIDEINRGELSKILGELFFAIDPGYRGRKGRVSTQYQRLITDAGDSFHDGFYVPENVYILGTMNDIDRSVESMDFAVRRRFAWKEVSAEQSAINMKLSPYATVKMKALNDSIKKHELDSAYFIGGAYFRGLDNKNFAEVWEYHLRGVVSEYFRGNPSCSDIVEEIHQDYLNG